MTTSQLCVQVITLPTHYFIHEAIVEGKWNRWKGSGIGGREVEYVEGVHLSENRRI